MGGDIMPTFDNNLNKFALTVLSQKLIVWSNLDKLYGQMINNILKFVCFQDTKVCSYS